MFEVGDSVKLSGCHFDMQIASQAELYADLKHRVQKVTEIRDVSALEGTTGQWVKTDLHGEWVDKYWYEAVERQVPAKPHSAFAKDLRDLLQKHGATLSYTTDDDGVHIGIASISGTISIGWPDGSDEHSMNLMNDVIHPNPFDNNTR